MSATIKLLIVEHDPYDIELMEYELKKGGVDYIAEIVQNESDYITALTNFIPDIILSDYSLPSFDGPNAFKIKQQLAPDIPFIFVSGYIGEENSIELIRSGVTDYVLKDKLFSLTVKVKRALHESLEKQLKDKTERERVRSELRLARAEQVAHMGSWELDFDTNMVLLSEESCRIYGLAAGQNQQSFENWLSFIHPDDFDFVSKKVKDAQESLRNFSFYHRIVRADGFVRHVYSESKLEFDAAGKLAGLHGIKQDVTEIKMVNEKLRASESSLKEAQAIAQVGNWEFDMVDNLHVWSDEMYKIFGISKDEVSPSVESYSSFIHPDDLNYAYSRMQEAFKTLENSSFVFRLVRKDGIVRYGYCEWKFDFGKNRNAERIFGIIQDVTERKLAELERTKMVNDLMQRNKDLEQFAYIVSHNLRAPVANILGAASGLAYSGISIKEKEMLNYGLKQSVTKLDDVVKDLNHILQVKREITEIKEKVRFSKLVDDIKISIQNVIESDNIEIKCDFSEIDEFLTIKSYMYSIFYNLISNSIKYRQPEVAGVIEIKSHCTKDKLELIFTDNGLGIDLEKKGDQVFGLYKRFHAHIEGKGMGLFMVKTQVETLEGKIGIWSEVNKGTEFKIEFEI